MFHFLEKSLNETFSATFGENVEKNNDVHQLKNTYISKINMVSMNTRTVYFIFERIVAVKMSELMLFEDNPDEAILKDMVCEMANLVVGGGKVKASEKGIHFNISIPEFIEQDMANLQLMSRKQYKFHGAYFIMAIGK